MRIQALILARDEAHNLDACIGSLRGVADAVLVCDTGSRDDTLGRARTLGAECLSIAWRDSFAAARNAALAAARADWVLVLDADERLASACRTRLRAALHQASPAATALALEVRTYTHDLESLGLRSVFPAVEDVPVTPGFVTELQPRLLRPRRGLQYTGRACERLTGPGALVHAGRPVAVVHHVRELGDATRRDHRERLRLRLVLREFLDTGGAPDAARLGMLLCRARRWRAGLSYLRAAERGDGADATLHLQAGVAQLHLGLIEGAIQSLHCAYRAQPGHPEVGAQLARALLCSEGTTALAQAGALLMAALEQDPELDVAVHQTAVWHRRRQEYDEARAYLHTLLDRHPGHASALRELGVVALLQGRLGEAEHSLRRACRARPEDAEAWNNLGCVLERRGLWQEARIAFLQATRFAPWQARLQRNLCLAHAACGDAPALRASTAALLSCSVDGEETLRTLRERLLEAGWIEPLHELEQWALQSGWLTEAVLPLPSRA